MALVVQVASVPSDKHKNRLGYLCCNLKASYCNHIAKISSSPLLEWELPRVFVLTQSRSYCRDVALFAKYTSIALAVCSQPGPIIGQRDKGYSTYLMLVATYYIAATAGPLTYNNCFVLESHSRYVSLNSSSSSSSWPQDSFTLSL